MDLRDDITTMKGVGPKKAQLLNRLDIAVIEDLLRHYPRNYQDRREITPLALLKDGNPALTCGRVSLVVKEYSKYKQKQILRVLVEDSLPGGETDTMEVVFFHANYLEQRFKQGAEYYFYGIPKIQWGKKQMIFPEFFQSDQSASGPEPRKILPLYPLTRGITQRELRRLVENGLKAYDAPDYLPRHIIEENRLCQLDFALRGIHFPKDKEMLKASKFRLIFDELYLMELGLLMMGGQNRKLQRGIQLRGETDEFQANLPFRLTAAQLRVKNEIEYDMESGHRMNRLIQGDVGSGKTVLAAFALYKAVMGGYQGVMMAPTELLATQHQNTLRSLFEGVLGPDGTPVNIGMLTGGLRASEKRRVLEEINNGKLQIVVGTHALLEPGVSFKGLGVVVTDEQHRFGVEQRMLLNEKGDRPHIMVMTATPIPRTLAMVIFGDMDISVLDEKPKGRLSVITSVKQEIDRHEVYRFVESELKKGRQAFVVTPLIEESDMLEVKSTEEVYRQLKKELKDYEIASLHGEMTRAQKDDTMRKFVDGEIRLLVSTVVIEVGIDVPNATVMVVENAERFGLAQLHQLRGRVGRGTEQSHCILISQSAGEYAAKRGEIMASSNDGFFIAEKDLQLRGPGEFFGTRQHGLPELKLADLTKHVNILELAKSQAERTLAQDPNLDNCHILKSKVDTLFEKGTNL